MSIQAERLLHAALDAGLRPVILRGRLRGIPADTPPRIAAEILEAWRTGAPVRCVRCPRAPRCGRAPAPGQCEAAQRAPAASPAPVPAAKEETRDA